MKPSESIQKILKRNEFTRHIKISDTESVIVAGIIQYLDEEHEKNKTPEQRQLEQVSFSISNE